MDKKKIIKILGGVALLCVIVLGVIAWKYYSVNRRPEFTRNVNIYVLPGMTAEDILSQVPDSSIVRRSTLQKAFKDQTVFQPGYYVAEKGKPSIFLSRMIRKGWQTPVNLVLAGSLRSKGIIARKISRQMMIDSLEVIQALNDSSLLAEYGFTPTDVFSLFIPDNYEVYWTDSIKVVLDKQKKAYDSFWSEENLKKAKAQGLTPKEVSIVASIVKSESNYEPEYPSIACVYLNRLRTGMKLQADPTVAFCYDYTLNRILRSHLEVDSPYNTYKYNGLPPGPICVPDRAALKAVLNPDNHDYYYFCASPDMNGTHRFAKDYSEHQVNAREFQRALDARIAAKR